MASFVEEATLVLRDEATKNASKINKEMRKLVATAQALEKALAGKGNSPFAKLYKDADRLSASLKKLNAQKIVPKVDSKPLDKLASSINRANAKKIEPKVNMAQVDRLASKINALHDRTIRINADVDGDMIGARVRDDGHIRRSADILGNVIGNIVGNAIYNAGAKLLDKTTKAVMTADDARGYGEAIFSVMSDNNKIAAAGQRKLDFLAGIAKRDSARSDSVVSEGQRLYSLIDAQTNIPKGADAFDYFSAVSRRMDQITKVFGLVDRDMASAAESTKEVERALSAIDRQGIGADDRAVLEGILKTKLQAGEQLNTTSIVNMMQQFQGLAKGFDANVIADALNVREEGGRMSTSSFRSLVVDLTKGVAKSFDKEGKVNKATGATVGAINAQIAAGFRDPKTGAVFENIAKDFGTNFIDATFKYIEPKLKLKGDETTTEIAAKAQSMFNLPNTSAKAIADIIFSKDRIQQQRREREGLDINAIMKVETLRTSMGKLDAAFQTLAQKAITPMVPTIQAGVNDMAETMQKLSSGTATTEDYLKMARTGALIGTATSLAGLTSSDPGVRALSTAGAALSSAAGLLSQAALSLWPDNKRPELLKPEDTKQRFAELQANVKRFGEIVNDPTKQEFGRTKAEQQYERANKELADFVEARKRAGLKLKAAEMEQESVLRAQAQAAQFDKYGRELLDATAVNNATAATNAFAQSLYQADGSLKSYSDQLKAIEAETIGTATDKPAAFKAYTKDVADAVSQRFGLKQDQKFGQDDLSRLGFKSVAEMQKAIGAPVDNVFGPVTAHLLETSQVLKDAVAEWKSLGAKSATGEIPIPSPAPRDAVTANNVSINANNVALPGTTPTGQFTQGPLADRLPGVAPTIEQTISTSIQDGSNRIETTITTGAQSIQSAMSTAAASAGGTIGQGLVAVAAQVGSTIGSTAAARMSAAVANVSVNVNTNSGSKPVDRGANTFANRNL